VGDDTATAAGTGLGARIRIALRWRDMDMLGHLNQAVYHELLEEGRAALFAEVAQRLHSAHTAWVLARVELDYRHEVRRDHGHVDVVARVGRVGTSSLRIDHEVVLPDGTVAAEGLSILVGWDAQARGKRALTEEERRVFEGAAA
jgi:acyl-CoA thioester hydrolase